MELNAKITNNKVDKSHSESSSSDHQHQQRQIKKSKKLKHQQKLARLVANTFGPDSIDLFKSTMSAAAAVESAVAAHASHSVIQPDTKLENKSEIGQAALCDPTQSSASHSKTTKKLNKKFNLLQKKITSLIESNHLEPLTFATNAASAINLDMANSNRSSNNAINKNQLEKRFKNFQIEDDEVSEVIIKTKS